MRFIRPLLLNGTLVLALAACTSAAKFGDTAIRTGSLGRVQATPFMDFVNTEQCRDTLTQAIGFTHQTQTVTNGVQIVQSFQCDADHIVARVSLKNLNAYTMQCVTRTEDGEHASVVEPFGFARFEYAFQQSSSHACAITGGAPMAG
ncbi:MAG: hypothetical protein AAF437_14790 [Pseudomonadota bacterium]